jgi:S-adenosylmethionine-diacylgycerolhomoserine-N-methlytransferase
MAVFTSPISPPDDKQYRVGFRQRWSELRTLWHLAIRPIQGADHASRLSHFYQGQAADYDSFRRRLLTGRRELLDDLPIGPNDYWIDMGGGTGISVDLLGPRIHQLARFDIVDLCGPLLERARKRVHASGLDGIVKVIDADATHFQPDRRPDVILFSYALTMIPDWYSALQHAARLLAPHGRIAVVDFYVSRRYPTHPGAATHGWLTRTGWPAWFGLDNVWLSPDHLPVLHHYFSAERLIESRAAVPYLPGLRVPVYRFIGTPRVDAMRDPGLLTVQSPSESNHAAARFRTVRLDGKAALDRECAAMSPEGVRE